jgi:sarcosine oxidase gamma subunit
LPQLTSLEREGLGMLIEVEGKWQEVRIAAEHARRILSRGIDVDAVLAGRDCAAIMLFDCPAILARHEETFNLWIAASFAHSLLAVSAALPNLYPGA